MIRHAFFATMLPRHQQLSRLRLRAPAIFSACSQSAARTNMLRDAPPACCARCGVCFRHVTRQRRRSMLLMLPPAAYFASLFAIFATPLIRQRQATPVSPPSFHFAMLMPLFALRWLFADSAPSLMPRHIYVTDTAIAARKDTFTPIRFSAIPSPAVTLIFPRNAIRRTK